MIAGNTSILISTFYLGETLWGLDTLDAQEVIRVPDITQVHNADDYVLGIINLRGKIVTIIDLSRKLGIGSSTISESSKIIIVEWKGEHIGLMIDAISDVIDIDKSSLTSAPAAMNGTRGGFIDSVYQTGKQLIAIINVRTVLEVTEDERESLA
ncbi:MAG: chemotaxis protein CheW [Spirochaetia bacterium]|jgi:purine-binding chemotaxis protein CheW|nr:chemotaxis protein CheW [Spirochaetia bacterium]